MNFKNRNRNSLLKILFPHTLLSFLSPRGMGIFITIVSSILPANCWDLSHRLGLGFVPGSIDIIGAPSLSVKFHQNQIVSYSGIFGLNTSNNSLMTGARLFRNAFSEDYMNYYLVVGAYLLNKQEGGVAKSGFQIDAMLGGEFRLPNLENLGLSFEAGLAIVQLAGAVTFKTAGASFVNAGIHYYF